MSRPASAPTPAILITVYGQDTPGITSTLTHVVAENRGTLLDIEQVVVQGQLTLCLLLSSDPEGSDPVLKEMLFAAKRMGLEMQFRLLDEVGQSVLPRAARYAVTAIGEDLGRAGMGQITRVLAAKDANIEHIRRLSTGRLLSVEIVCSLASEAHDLRQALIHAVEETDIDIAVQRERITRRNKRLVVMDMDSTLIQIEVIDELARMHGVVDRVAEITTRAMAGELDFEESLRARVALLEGMEVERAHELARRLPLTQGARDFLGVIGRLGYKTGVISGGFSFAANALKSELGVDYAYANELDVKDGVLTGTVRDPIVTPQRKADLLDAIAQREGIALEQTIAVGDGANDLTMLERAGLGIAFHAKPRLRAAADTSLSAGGLDRILYLLGLHEREVTEILNEFR
ncbi:MAG: phosphoserine phosphatase SerB [Myxococcota bacterium]